MPKSILTIGLEPAKAASMPTGVLDANPEDIRAKVLASVQQARDAGFEIDTRLIDPDNYAASVEAIMQTLRAKHLDGVVIGWGIRGLVEYTELFEMLVNAVWKAKPGVRLGFNTSPSDVHITIQRNFG